MKDLDRIVARIEGDLDAKDRAREASLRSARAITRLAGSAIRAMQRGEDPHGDLEAVRRETRALRGVLRDYPDLWNGPSVEGALQEVAEAAIVWSVLRRHALPSPEELGVTSAAYVLGLGDAIGELRRLALDRLRLGRVDEATRFVDVMEDMFHALMRFEYPDAIVAVRHKQDVARSLVERTRGELAVSARSAELERRLRELEQSRPRASETRGRGGQSPSAVPPSRRHRRRGGPRP